MEAITILITRVILLLLYLVVLLSLFDSPKKQE